MSAERTRSEYRLSPLVVPDDDPLGGVALGRVAIRRIERDDRAAAAGLMLTAYRGTIDDEGEDEAAALDAIDYYFSTIVWPCSFAVLDGGRLVAMSLVVIVDERHYIDPVATSGSHKGRGLGREVVAASLRALAEHGVTEVGATITDGNEPSERLFAGLGFERVGQWA
ncbi:MAG: GNAT family N-acetyltransferase [Ilumatobacteraceae bacterium]